MPLSPHPAPAANLESLIERCLHGDEAAWDAIVRQHWRKVFNVAYTFVGRYDEAEDLTQDIFLKVYRSLDTFDRRANFQTWLISITRNLCIDYYRSVRRERALVDRGVDARDLTAAASECSPFAVLERQDQVALLRQALGRLTPALRTAVILCDLKELSYQQIARQLKLPEGTVKSRIHRGRAELARQLRRLLTNTAARAPEGTTPPVPAAQSPSTEQPDEPHD